MKNFYKIKAIFVAFDSTLEPTQQSADVTALWSTHTDSLGTALWCPHRATN
jgi:hypothetical protein